jgi:uncharacterized protein (DUF1800 family)
VTVTTRRQFLTASAAVVAGAAVSSQLPAAELAQWIARPRVAWAAGRTVPMPPPSPELHLLNRATWGPTAAELARVKAMGLDAWIDEQLAWDHIDDHAVDQALTALPSLGWTVAEIKANAGKRPIRNELIVGTLYRAVNSRRQLLEVMVDYWSSHFNVYHPEELISIVKTLDDREVIRKNALGSFRDMLHASAASPAMMRYLNTVQNTKSGPNENYGREVMELHTLGVATNGVPYTETDVKQMARAFTGWGFATDTWAFSFNAGNHDTSSKTVLGHKLLRTGSDEAHEALDVLVNQPACALHVASRLVRRFVDDTPPDSLVTKVADAFGRDGDIRAMMGVLLRSPEFRQSFARADLGPAKVRRPMEAWAAPLRAAGADVSGMLDVPTDSYDGDNLPGNTNYDGRAERYLALMDHLPFRWRTPDGYPDQGPRWGGMHVMVSRWNYGLSLAEERFTNVVFSPWDAMTSANISRAPDALVDFWAKRLVLRDLLATDRQRLIDYVGAGSLAPLSDTALDARVPVLIALLLDSPYAQRR